MNDQQHKLTLTLGVPDEKNIYQLVVLRGEMDKFGLSLVKEQLEKLVDGFTYRYFVLDFSDLNFIISESIGFLMTLHAHLVKEKKTLVIVAAKAHVKDVLLAIGVLSVFEYYDSFEDFKNKIA